MALDLSHIDFQNIITGLTGHSSSAGLVGAVGTLIAGDVASNIISSAVKGGALSIVDPLGLATHLAGAGASPAAVSAAAGVAAPAPAAANKTIPVAAFIAMGPDAQKAVLAAGYVPA